MPKTKASPKHNPGKFRTHLAQALKHLELAKAEHEKLEKPNTDIARAIRIQLCESHDHAHRAWQDFVVNLRPSLPGYIAVTETNEEEGE